MSKNTLKIIYGDNGIGKSLYYSQHINKNKYLPFNYDLEHWYDSSKKTFSELNIKGKEISKEILNLSKSFLDDIKKEKEYEITQELFNNLISFLNNENKDNKLQKWKKIIQISMKLLILFIILKNALIT